MGQFVQDLLVQHGGVGGRVGHVAEAGHVSQRSVLKQALYRLYSSENSASLKGVITSAGPAGEFSLCLSRLNIHS